MIKLFVDRNQTNHDEMITSEKSNHISGYNLKCKIPPFNNYLLFFFNKTQ